jgi:hypothetical protein
MHWHAISERQGCMAVFPATKDRWIDLRPEREQRRYSYFDIDRDIAHA